MKLVRQIDLRNMLKFYCDYMETMKKHIKIAEIELRVMDGQENLHTLQKCCSVCSRN